MDKEHVRDLLRRLAVLAFLLLLATYIGSYAFLSRRGLREAKKYDMDGFLYVPLDDALRKKDLSRNNTSCCSTSRSTRLITRSSELTGRLCA